MFPENVIQATFEHVHTVEKVVRPSIKALRKNDSATVALLANGAYDFTKPVVEYTSGINVLGKNRVDIRGSAVPCRAAFRAVERGTEYGTAP